MEADRELYKKLALFSVTIKRIHGHNINLVLKHHQKLSELRKKSAQVEENLNNLQNNCPSFSKDDLISKKDFNVLQEKIKSCLIVWL